MVALALVCLTQWSEGGDGDKARKHGRSDSSVQEAPPGASAARQEPWLDVRVAIGDDERQVIREHLKGQEGQCQHQQDGDSEKRSHRHGGLPPGLQKKVARGGTLPPGWQKKCVKGEVLPPEVYERARPLPEVVVAKLPTPPPGTILITIDGKVARIAKATREILDVFDVKL